MVATEHGHLIMNTLKRWLDSSELRSRSQPKERKGENTMKTTTIVNNIEEAKGLVNAMLEDEEIKDFEIIERASGECEVTMWNE